MVKLIYQFVNSKIKILDKEVFYQKVSSSLLKFSISIIPAMLGMDPGFGERQFYSPSQRLIKVLESMISRVLRDVCWMFNIFEMIFVLSFLKQDYAYM